MPSGSKPAPRHVLIVDDEPDFVDELRLYLRRRGWQVTASHTPQDALAQLERHADIVVAVTDVRISNLDGFALACQIQSERRGGSVVAVIVVTGHGELARTEAANAPMPLPILRKPLNMPDFLAELEAAVVRAHTARAAGQALRAGPSPSNAGTASRCRPPPLEG